MRYVDFVQLCDAYGPLNARALALGNNVPEGRVRHWLIAMMHLGR